MQVIESSFAMNHPWTIRWHIYLPQLALFCLGNIVFFALWYWSIDTLNWGWLLNREGRRETQFLEFLYFSMGTFFRIGYGDQVPLGFSRWIAGLEGFSNYVIEVMVIVRVVTNFLGKFVSLSIRERLETLFNRYE